MKYVILINQQYFLFMQTEQKLYESTVKWTVLFFVEFQSLNYQINFVVVFTLKGIR
jgi:hypothetical protein